MSTPTERNFRRTFLVTLSFFCVVGGEFYLFYWLHTRYDLHPALMLLVMSIILICTMAAATAAVAPPAVEVEVEDEA